MIVNPMYTIIEPPAYFQSPYHRTRSQELRRRWKHNKSPKWSNFADFEEMEWQQNQQEQGEIHIYHHGAINYDNDEDFQ